MFALEIVKYKYSIELPLILRGSAPVMLLFFYMGIFLSKYSRDYSLWIPVALMIVGLITGLIQMDYIETYTDMPGQGQKITLFLFDVGFILLCMSKKCEYCYSNNWFNRFILFIGEMSFGIYFTHIYIIWFSDRIFPSLREDWVTLWISSLLITILIIHITKKLAPKFSLKYLGYR